MASWMSVPAATLLLTCMGSQGWAQEAPNADHGESRTAPGGQAISPGGQPSGPGAQSGSLEEQLQKALQADQAQQKANQPPAPPPSIPVPSTVSRAFQSLNPDLSFIADFALAAFTGPRNQVGEHDPHTNGFNLQAAEISLGAAVDPYFRFDSNMAFSASGGFELEEAYATTLALPGNLQLRAGKFLTRFGRLNPNHPHTWDFADMPLVLGKFFGGDGNRGVGLEASELLSFLPWYAEVVLTFMNPEEVPVGSSGQYTLFTTPPETRSPADIEYMAALKQFFPLSDNLSLAWGLSSLFDENPLGLHGRTTILGTDIYLKYRPINEASFTIISLTIEALYRRRYDLTAPSPAPLLNDGGGYAQLFWRFAQRWGVATRFDMATGDTNDIANPDWTRPQYRGSVALTFWPTEFSRIRLQANYFRDLAATEAGESVFLAFEIAAGAHGAHAF